MYKRQGRIYVMGGNTNAGVTTASVEAYTPATDTWETVASIPTGRYSFATAAAGPRIFAFGGWAAGQALAVVEAYTP